MSIWKGSVRNLIDIDDIKIHYKLRRSRDMTMSITLEQENKERQENQKEAAEADNDNPQVVEQAEKSGWACRVGRGHTIRWRNHPHSKKDSLRSGALCDDSTGR